ncbi:hypothetical protein Esti_003244 [Eimeria stiedai]
MVERHRIMVQKVHVQLNALACWRRAAAALAVVTSISHVSASQQNQGNYKQEGLLGMSASSAAGLAVTALCCLLAVIIVVFKSLTRTPQPDRPQLRVADVRKKKNDRSAMEELMARGPGAPETPDSKLCAAQRRKEEREQRRAERRQQEEEAAAAAAAAAAVAPAAQSEAAGESEEEAGPPVSHKQAKQEAYRRRQAERDRLRAEKEAEEERLAEEKRKKEQEEYEEWKKAFEVEAEGELEVSPEKEAQELERFLAFIRMRKAVDLEEIAAEFGLKTKAGAATAWCVDVQDCVKRIESLREEGRLCGVLDDRGRFLCLTDDELQKVAAALKSQGRFSKETDLVHVCNRIIRLVPSEEDKERIEEEQLTFMRLVQLAAAEE